jgi:hypothetical protein
LNIFHHWLVELANAEPACITGQLFLLDNISLEKQKKKKKKNWFCLALRQKAWGENIASKMMPRYPSCAENK